MVPTPPLTPPPQSALLRAPLLLVPPASARERENEGYRVAQRRSGDQRGPIEMAPEMVTIWSRRRPGKRKLKSPVPAGHVPAGGAPSQSATHGGHVRAGHRHRARGTVAQEIIESDSSDGWGGDRRRWEPSAPIPGSRRDHAANDGDREHPAENTENGHGIQMGVKGDRYGATRRVDHGDCPIGMSPRSRSGTDPRRRTSRGPRDQTRSTCGKMVRNGLAGSPGGRTRRGDA